MAYNLPDLSNLRMEEYSIPDPPSPRSPLKSVSEEGREGKEGKGSSKAAKHATGRSSPRYSLKSTLSRALSPDKIASTIRTKDVSNNPYDQYNSPTARNGDVPNSPYDRHASPVSTNEMSNNPYDQYQTPPVQRNDTSNNPFTRPDLTRYKSVSLDLPRSSKNLASTPSLTTATPQTTGDSENTRRRHEEDSIAATFGLGHLRLQDEFVEYTVWNASLTNMRVCPVHLDGGRYFYVEHRSFIPNRPGVKLHAGSTRDGPTVGVGHLDYFSTSNQLGVGDPENDPMGMIWEKLHKESFWTHMRYSFLWPINVEVDGLQEVENRRFEWHRTKNNFIVDDQGDLVLIEMGKDEILAQYTGKGPLGQVMKQRGVLKIKDMKDRGFGDGWEVMVLLGWASIVELSRRRARQRRISGIFGHI